MKIYIATSGIYSDYHIDAVFTDKNQAEIYAAIHGNDAFSIEIEEWDSDEIKLSPHEIYNLYEIRLTDEMKEVSVSDRLTISEKKPKIRKEKHDLGFCRFVYGYTAVFTTERDVSREQAVKIARDYIYQYRMEQIENDRAALSALMGDVTDES